MFKRVIWPVIALILSVNSIAVQAQQRQTGNVQSELSMVWSLAQGSFGDNLDRPIPGLMVSFGGQAPNLPLVLSTEIGWLNYGFDNHLEIRFPEVAAPSTPAVSVVNVETSNNILMTHLVARLVPLEGKIVPYIDGLIGFKYLLSNVAIEGEALFDDDNLIIIADEDRLFTSSTFSSFALSYGAGAGVDVQVFNGPLGMNKNNAAISMHIGARYLFGSEADYLTENSILAQTDRIHFEPAESNTNMIIPKLGIRIGL